MAWVADVALHVQGGQWQSSQSDWLAGRNSRRGQKAELQQQGTACKVSRLAAVLSISCCQ